MTSHAQDADGLDVLAYLVMRDTDVVCMECDRPIPYGYPYGESLEGMNEENPITSVVCVYCA